MITLKFNFHTQEHKLINDYFKSNFSLVNKISIDSSNYFDTYYIEVVCDVSHWL